MEDNQIPEGWEKLYLNEIFEFKYGTNLPTIDLSTDGFPVYGANGIIGFHTKFNYLNSEILISCRGENSGVINVSKEKSFITNNSIICKYKFEVDKTFFYYNLKTIDRLKMVSGSAQPQVVIKDLNKIDIVFPKSTTEQQSIANILSKTDQAIAHTEALIAKYTRIKTGLMQDLLTKGIDQNGNIRTEQTHKFKDSPLGRIPYEWECEKLNSVCNIYISGVDKKTHFGEKAVYLCNYMDVYSNREINAKIDYMQVTATDSEIKKFQLKIGDVIITKDSETPDDIAVPTVVKEVFDNLICGYHLALIRPKSNLLGGFLMFQLLNHSSKKYFGSLATGSTRFGLKLGSIENFPTFIPSLDEQYKLVSIIEKNQNLILEEMNNLTKLQSLKTGLMQDLLSGKVRVKVSEAGFTGLEDKQDYTDKKSLKSSNQANPDTDNNQANPKIKKS